MQTIPKIITTNPPTPPQSTGFFSVPTAIGKRGYTDRCGDAGMVLMQTRQGHHSSACNCRFDSCMPTFRPMCGSIWSKKPKSKPYAQPYPQPCQVPTTIFLPFVQTNPTTITQPCFPKTPNILERTFLESLRLRTGWSDPISVAEAGGKPALGSHP